MNQQRHRRRNLLMVSFLALLTGFSHTSFAACHDTIALQVLGSGGPIADDGRASSGYLLWIDGRARLLIDAGGGVFLRFGEAGARMEDLDAVILTHLHTDHSADLPALLKSGYFSPRRRPLAIVGPTGAARWPTTSEFIDGLFVPGQGVYRYLDGFADGSDGLFQLQPRDVDSNSFDPVTVLNGPDYRAQVVGVRHGPVPALGVFIEARGKRIAISGDQNDNNPGFARLIEGSDLLFMDHAIPENAGRIARNLHATPGHIGKLALQTGVKHLVLTHLMERSLNQLAQSKTRIRQSFTGMLTIAEDLMCVTP